MQVNENHPYNFKALMKKLTHMICNIKPSKRCKLSPNLENYLQMLAENITHQGISPNDFRPKEALMNAFGNVADLMTWQKNGDVLSKIEQVLKEFVFPELESNNPCL